MVYVWGEGCKNVLDLLYVVGESWVVTMLCVKPYFKRQVLDEYKNIF